MVDLIHWRTPDEPGTDDVWWPIINSDQTIRFAEDEAAQYWHAADVMQYRYVPDAGSGGSYEFCWDVAGLADITFTDRRLLYTARALTTDERHNSAWQLMSASGSQHEETTGLYAGQVRFEWPDRIALQAQRTLGFTVAAMILTCRLPHGRPIQVVVAMRAYRHGFTTESVTRIASALASNIARFRLANMASSLTPDAINRLTAQQDAPEACTDAVGDLYWMLPGAMHIGQLAGAHRGTWSGTDSSMPKADGPEAVPKRVSPRADFDTKRGPVLPKSFDDASSTRARASEAASVGPVPHQPDQHMKKGLFLDKLAMLFAVALVLFALASVPMMRTELYMIDKRDAARAATASGNVRAAARAWMDLNAAAPRSIEALLNLSCIIWDLGYQEEAINYYQTALIAGVPWDRVLIASICFINAPRFYRLSLVEVQESFPLLYVTPKQNDDDGKLLAEIAHRRPSPQRATDFRKAIGSNDTPSDSQVVLAISCLNDRAGLPYVAATAITLALNDPNMHANGILKDCLRSYVGRYVVLDKGGLEMVLPNDLQKRIFLPESSPIPSPMRRALP